MANRDSNSDDEYRTVVHMHAMEDVKPAKDAQRLRAEQAWLSAGLEIGLGNIAD